MDGSGQVRLVATRSFPGLVGGAPIAGAYVARLTLSFVPEPSSALRLAAAAALAGLGARRRRRGC